MYIYIYNMYIHLCIIYIYIYTYIYIYIFNVMEIQGRSPPTDRGIYIYMCSLMSLLMRPLKS